MTDAEYKAYLKYCEFENNLHTVKKPIEVRVRKRRTFSSDEWKTSENISSQGCALPSIQ